MGSDLAPIAPALPWWVTLAAILVGPTGLGVVVLKLGSRWLARAQKETEARDTERKEREKQREEERAAIVALPGKVEDLTKAVKEQGEKIDKALARVEQAERERSDADREDRVQFRAVLATMAANLGMADGMPRVTPSPPQNTGVRRMMGSSPGQR